MSDKINLRAYPTARAICECDEGIPDALRACALAMCAHGAGDARLCLHHDDGAMFVLGSCYLSVLADGTVIDGLDALKAALTEAQAGAPPGQLSLPGVLREPQAMYY